MGYFLINGLTADLRANLIKQCISRLQSIKLTVVSVTCDDLNSNIVMANKLGCNFNAEDLDTSFDIGGYSIQLMLDACHMIKLMRNLFGDMKVLKVLNDNVIEWKFIDKLEQIQTNETITIANKLSKCHVHFKNQKMKLKLAVQVPGASV